jgi:hypothetical protein
MPWDANEQTVVIRERANGRGTELGLIVLRLSPGIGRQTVWINSEIS